MKTTIFFIATITLIIGCEKSFFEEAPQNNPVSIFEELWNRFDTDYAIFDERNVDWDEAYAIFRPMVTDETTDEELQHIFKEMLKVLDDGHVDLVYPNQKIFTSNRIYDELIDDELFDLDLIRKKYLNENYMVNGYSGNTYGLINDNIGYVHFKWTSDNFRFMDEILDEFEEVDGLVIDLRHNGGGQLTDALQSMGRFTKEDRYTQKSRTKNGPEVNDFDEWFEWILKPGGEYFDKKLILLTDRYTISAGERATFVFKTLPNLIHIGEITNGSLSTKLWHELPNGWLFSVCPQEVVSFDGRYLEGVGIAPDVEIRNTHEEMQNGLDKTLEKAISMLE